MRFNGDFEGFTFKHIVMKNIKIKWTFQNITLLLPSLRARTACFQKYNLKLKMNVCGPHDIIKRQFPLQKEILAINWRLTVSFLDQNELVWTNI